MLIKITNLILYKNNTYIYIILSVFGPVWTMLHCNAINGNHDTYNRSIYNDILTIWDIFFSVHLSYTIYYQQFIKYLVSRFLNIQLLSKVVENSDNICSSLYFEYIYSKDI